MSYATSRTPRWYDDLDEVTAFIRWYLEGSRETWHVAVDIVEAPWLHDEDYAGYLDEKKERLNS